VPFNRINTDILEQFRKIIGEDYVIVKDETLLDYGHDYTEDLSFLPEVVLKPSTAIEVSSLMKICNLNLIPVTARGAGTGLSGGALPVHGGVCLSMERFNKIISIDEKNFQATVEPGVINQVFQEAVMEAGLCMGHPRRGRTRG